MVVFLKTSEEAKCEPEDTCKWEYTSQVPEVKDIAVKWDKQKLYYYVEVTGTDFSGSKETTDFFIDGLKQETVSVEPTKAQFKVTKIKAQNLRFMKLYFDVGVPKGHDKIIDSADLKVEPIVTKISPNKGSVGGTLLTAYVEGLAMPANADEEYLKKERMTLIKMANGRDYC